MYDNYELTVAYYKKAAGVRPVEPDPYLDAADCYDPDLNTPPISVLITFLKQGTASVRTPTSLYQRLARLYEICGNDEMSMYYLRKAGEGPIPPPPAGPPESQQPRQ